MAKKQDIQRAWIYRFGQCRSLEEIVKKSTLSIDPSNGMTRKDHGRQLNEILRKRKNGTAGN